MPLLFLLLFIGTPIVEIAVFIQAGDLIGLWPTLGGIVLTAVIGAALVRAQGLAALGRAQAQIEKNAVPVNEVFTAACLLIAGAMLLTPGFLTDTVGFLLLIPGLRQRIGRGLLGMFSKNARFTMHSARPGPPGGPGFHSGFAAWAGVTDAEHETVDPRATPTPSADTDSTVLRPPDNATAPPPVH